MICINSFTKILSWASVVLMFNHETYANTLIPKNRGNRKNQLTAWSPVIATFFPKGITKVLYHSSNKRHNLVLKMGEIYETFSNV